MHSKRSNYAKNILFPCLLFSVITGIFTGILIFLFKAAASWIISASSGIYAYVRENPVLLPALIGGAAVVGLISAFVLKRVPDCRGGGIPTSIVILRGLAPFNWIKSVVFVFFSAMLTYFCGIPLGNEGPSVQMGTAVGRGTVNIFAGKNHAWDRYIMTGGACAGFAVATGSPLTGIFFAFEEAHRRFSPMIFMAASMAVIASTTTMQILCAVTNTSPYLFNFSLDTVLPLKYIWAAVIVGAVCGLCTAVFTKSYRALRKFLKTNLAKFPFILKTVLIFAGVSVIGFFSDDCLSSGHHLIDELYEGHGVWYFLIIIFCVRALLLIVANNSGITGGLFVPSLAFGAIIGAVCGKAFVAAGIIPDEYYPIMVIIGMAAFLGSCSRTPIMAIAFGIEALDGLSNILPIVIGVTIAYLVIETLGISAFTETVIEAKVEAAHAGKTAHIVDTRLTVKEGSFAVGKEIRDILWPPTCVILSVRKNPKNAGHYDPEISEGDEFHVHYQTYDPEETMKNLESLLGVQDSELNSRVRLRGENHQVPEI